MMSQPWRPWRSYAIMQCGACRIERGRNWTPRRTRIVADRAIGPSDRPLESCRPHAQHHRRVGDLWTARADRGAAWRLESLWVRDRGAWRRGHRRLSRGSRLAVHADRWPLSLRERSVRPLRSDSDWLADVALADLRYGRG